MFQKAVKESRKLRLAIYGVSGSGKTYSALAIASGLGKKIAVIDTERHSASLYADDFKFDVASLDQPTVKNCVAAFKDAKDAGYDVLILDSGSLVWDELLQEVDKIAKAKYRGNTFAAWMEGTPLQKSFINGMMDYPGHVIMTMRAATEYDITKEDGKNKIEKIGLKPQQRAGVDYEFDVVMRIDSNHLAFVEKSRYKIFQDRAIEKPTAELGTEILTYLKGAEPAPKPEPKSVQEMVDACKTIEDLNKLFPTLSDEQKADTKVVEMFKKAKKNLPPA